MTKSLFGRMRAVVVGNLDSLVEAAERHSTGALMREALREIDRLVETRRGDLARLDVEAIERDARRTAIKDEVKRLDGDARYAFDHDRRDLAGVVVARQIDLEAELGTLAAADGAAPAERERLAGELHALLARRAAMAAEFAASTPPTANAAPSATATVVDSAQDSFDRALAMRRADASASTETAVAEVDALKRQEAIEARLAKLATPATRRTRRKTG